MAQDSRVPTASASNGLSAGLMQTVASLDGLLASGWTYSAVRAQLDGGRWRRFGRAVLLHNAEPGQLERHTSKWNTSEHLGARPVHRTAPALVLAASTFRHPRPACGIVAAGVQQRIVRAQELAEAVKARPRLRHRRILQLAIDDIAQGAHALSEIDFVRLCRRYRLPEPRQQVVRRGPDGRQRYLDAEWIRHDGRRVVAEVDGGLHLAAARWWQDQLRQNDLVIADSLVLRFPSIVLRTEPALVVAQLVRALQL